MCYIYGRHAHLETTTLYQKLGPQTNAQCHLALQNCAPKLLPAPTVSDSDKKPTAEDKKSCGNQEEGLNFVLMCCSTVFVCISSHSSHFRPRNCLVDLLVSLRRLLCL
jgi:hypothetical protein